MSARAASVLMPRSARPVEGRDGGGAALGLDAVQQHRLAVRAQAFDGGDGVVEDEVQVWVLLRADAVDETHLDPLVDVGCVLVADDAQ